MDNALKADLLVMVHFAFVLFVVIGQLYIWVGLVARWGAVRNFWFRIIHLLCIVVVAAEGLTGVVAYHAADRGWLDEETADYLVDKSECPLTRWERDLREGGLRDVEDSIAPAKFANRILFHAVEEGGNRYFQYGHIAFGVLVLLTFIVFPPRLPWRKPAT